ncbi:MAG: hypothetical protein JO353_02955 [Phycisphaerae bacterium]|nr:hypothetical protein [Phycisphaerae bacterium]
MQFRRLAFFAALLLSLNLAFAQNTSALINEQLDKQTSLNLNGVLGQAVQSIQQNTGVPFEVSPDVYALLPWGDQTNITAKIENQTLRQALDAITQKLGLIYVVKDEVVELEPMPALTRLGRRATVQELNSLDLLAATSLEPSAEKMPVHALVEAIDQKLQKSKSALAIDYRPGDTVLADQSIFVPRNATLMEALDTLIKQTRVTWYPWGKSIVIVPKAEQIHNLLNKTITVHYPGTDIAQVLTELSQKADVPFEIEPGAIQRVAPEFRKVKLDLYDASINRALEAIAGFTGLGFVVDDKGVYLWNQSNSPNTAGHDPTIGLIQLDNGMQVLIHQSAIPPDMQEYLKVRTQRELQKIREMMKEENFKPTTQATTRPANEDL